MADAAVATPSRAPFRTLRRDRWWLVPLLTFLAFSAFLVYSGWAAFQGRDYAWGPYLSPLYSPLLFGEPHGWFGPRPGWWPAALPFSAALLILWAPGGFRVTCYYYRGAYYKAFWADPPSCTVGEPRHSYRGEQRLPLILQNVHRYFLYLALVFIVILTYDVWTALWFEDPATGRASFGVGVGTLVLAVNTFLLGGYTFSCHSLRHLVGGGRDELSGAPLCQWAYTCASRLNRKHMVWAWLSLFWVAFADVYVRMLATGRWTDLRLI
jgi:hypothetical protein